MSSIWTAIPISLPYPWIQIQLIESFVSLFSDPFGAPLTEGKSPHDLSRDAFLEESAVRRVMKTPWIEYYAPVLRRL